MKENSPVQEAVSLLSVGSDDLALEVLSGFIVKTAQEAARKCGIPGYVDPVESIAAMRIMRIAALRLGDYAVESGFCRNLEVHHHGWVILYKPMACVCGSRNGAHPLSRFGYFK